MPGLISTLRLFHDKLKHDLPIPLERYLHLDQPRHLLEPRENIPTAHSRRITRYDKKYHKLLKTVVQV